MTDLDRRRFMARAIVGSSALLLSGCDKLSQAPWWRDDVLGSATDVSMAAQRALLPRDKLARTYSKAEISKHFRANGSTNPEDGDYKTLAANGFADYRLDVGGLVENPQKLELTALKSMPSQTQITRHDCVEGWSCIGQWTGVRLAHVLDLAKPKPQAKYVVFRCYDKLEQTLDNTGQYYESIDLIDAYHPQTILAYAMNGEALQIPYGAPLRVRIERQLGYKMAKYIRRIDVVESFADIERGKGGFWEDRGYQWYAGI